MGQKVHPVAFRIPLLRTWSSRWFAKKDYRTMLKEDVRVRDFVREKLKKASVSEVVIERSGGAIAITIYTSKPGVVIGRGGGGIEQLTKDIKAKFFLPKTNVRLSIQEVSQPQLSAPLIVQGMCEQLEKRIPFRRILKTTIDQVMGAGAKGVKVMVSGRLNGADIARREKLHEGSVPLHTLRADVDYARGTAATTYGSIGVKVWIYKGEVFEKEKQK